MSRANSIKIEAKEIYELTLYLNDEEYDRFKFLVQKSGFDCSKAIRNLLKGPLIVENNWEQWRTIIVPFRRLLSVYDQLCDRISKTAPIYEKLDEHRHKLWGADRKIHDIFLTDKWIEYIDGRRSK